MKRLYKLENPVKHYRWGSPVWIPRLLGRENPHAEPWAELWMGAHPGGPSRIAGEGIGLDALIAADAPRLLGADVCREFGALPFLFKLLAAGAPLSIQAHPNLEQARAGWERENRAGVPIDAANRNYRDPNHKPEILCALSPFKALCGFREPGEIRKRLNCFERELRRAPSLREQIAGLCLALDAADPGAALEQFTRGLLGLDEEVRGVLTAQAAENQEALERRAPEYAAEWRTVGNLASRYPGDPGILAPLYLNLLDLAPGEAVFLPAGVFHAYLEGFGVELMANSDNVLRGGLTEKHIDGEELIRVLRFAPHKPAVRKAPEGEAAFVYPAECREFSLSRFLGDARPRAIPASGPRILLVTEGRARLSAGGETLILNQGESAFAAPAEAPEGLTLTGDCAVYAAGAALG
ncbi:MAG: mannose-6-phosphate isomerase, class I [Treponema sp.]|jgi:mannose-6-phosphate isomerase|nr:mannose-6-phosphate isomerase, class I [Treponema sp.]